MIQNLQLTCFKLVNLIEAKNNNRNFSFVTNKKPLFESDEYLLQNL